MRMGSTSWPPKAAEKKLDIAYMMDDGIPAPMCGDVTRLRQVLVNLLSNGIKFTAAGEVVVQCRSCLPPKRIGKGSEPWQLHFQVRDTGVWHSRGPAGSPVQRPSASRRLDDTPVWRHRSRSGHQQTTGRVDGRQDVGRERAARRDHVPFHSALATPRLTQRPPRSRARTAVGRSAPC